MKIEQKKRVKNKINRLTAIAEKKLKSPDGAKGSLTVYKQVFDILKRFKDKSLMDRTTLRILNLIWESIGHNQDMMWDYCAVLEEVVSFLEDQISDFLENDTLSKCHIMLSLVLRWSGFHKKSNISLKKSLKLGYPDQDSVFQCCNLYLKLARICNSFDMGKIGLCLKQAKKAFEEVMFITKQMNLNMKGKCDRNTREISEVLSIFYDLFPCLSLLGENSDQFLDRSVEEAHAHFVKISKKLDGKLKNILSGESFYSCRENTKKPNQIVIKRSRSYAKKLKRISIFGVKAKEKIDKRFGSSQASRLNIIDDMDKLVNKNNFYFKRPAADNIFLTKNSEILLRKSSRKKINGKTSTKFQNISTGNLNRNKLRQESQDFKIRKSIQRYNIVGKKKQDKAKDVAIQAVVKKLMNSISTQTSLMTEERGIQADDGAVESVEVIDKSILTEEIKPFRSIKMAESSCQTERHHSANKKPKAAEIRQDSPLLSPQNLPKRQEIKGIASKFHMDRGAKPKIMIGDVLLANFDPNFSVKTVGPQTPQNPLDSKNISRRPSASVNQQNNPPKKTRIKRELAKLTSLKISNVPVAPNSLSRSPPNSHESPIKKTPSFTRDFKFPTINIKVSSPVPRKLKKTRTTFLPVVKQLESEENEEDKNKEEEGESTFFKRKITRTRTLATSFSRHNSFNDIDREMEVIKEKKGYFEFIPAPPKMNIDDESEKSQSIVLESMSDLGAKKHRTEYSLDSDEEMRLTKLEMRRKSFKRQMSKRFSTQKLENMEEIIENDFKDKDKLKDSINDSGTDSDFEIDDQKISLQGTSRNNFDDSYEDSVIEMDNCSLDETWIHRIEREMDENEDIRTALLFLQQFIKVWIKIFIRVKKWRIMNRRIFEQILKINNEKYIFLVYHKIETGRLRIELYCITKKFKPLTLKLSKKSSKIFLEVPEIILSEMTIDVEERVFEIKDIYQPSEGSSVGNISKKELSDNLSTKNALHTSGSPVENLRARNNDDNNLLLTTDKKKNGRDMKKLETFDDDFDIDVDNTSYLPPEYDQNEDCLISFDERGRVFGFERKDFFV